MGADRLAELERDSIERVLRMFDTICEARKQRGYVADHEISAGLTLAAVIDFNGSVLDLALSEIRSEVSDVGSP